MDSMDSEKLIVELNYKNEIIDERKKAGSFNSEKMFALLPESIIDKRTLKLIEIHDLFKAFDHSLTFVGSAKLFHSLVNPSESIELIHAKQDSFCEVESNDTLKNAITDYLETFRIGEPSLFKLLNAHLHPLLPYRDFNRAMETIKGMQKAAQAIPQPETVYLDSLIKSILSFSGSPVSSLVEGKAYRTLSGIRSKEEKHMLTPALRFRSGRLSGGTILPSMPAVYFGAGWLLGFMDPLVAKSLLLLTGGGSILGLVYGALFKPMFDYETAVLPIRRRIIESNRLASAVEAVAEIDELLSFVLYSQSSRHPTVIPEITNNPTHSFVAKELRNPTIAKGNEHFVANDVDLNGCKVTFITGPNSGGKTTYCKTIVQNQILGQIGAPIAARAAKINMADKITYQAPAFDSLNDPEGRFGTELKVTRDIFYSVTPQSLAILDEIAEGTTTREKMAFSCDIMNGFYRIGNNTLLVTHSHELVEKFYRQNKGSYLQVEFKDEKPTHRLIDGISKESHADRVARKIGFSSQDIENYLRSRGYN